MDHEWPNELVANARCHRCGLRYDQWTDPETLWCEGESEEFKAQINKWFEGGNN